MNCQECRKLLSEYQEGELESEVFVPVRTHLESCEACSRELDVFRKIGLLTSELPRYEPSIRAVMKVKSSTGYAGPGTQKRTEFGPVMDSDELAEFLRVTRDTIEEYIGQVPSFELGGKLLFRRKSIEEWIERREKDFEFQLLESEINSIKVLDDLSEGDNRWKI